MVFAPIFVTDGHPRAIFADALLVGETKPAAVTAPTDTHPRADGDVVVSVTRSAGRLCRYAGPHAYAPMLTPALMWALLDHRRRRR